MFIRILSGSLSLIRRPNNVPYLSVFTSSELEFRIQDSVWSNSFRKPFMSLSFLTLANVTNLFKKELINTCVCVCVRACVCVYILPPWRLLPTARYPRHAWEVWINDLVLWIFIWVLLPSSFISISESIIFHLQRRNSSPPKNWRENDMIYCAPAKRWYI